MSVFLEYAERGSNKGAGGGAAGNYENALHWEVH